MELLKDETKQRRLMFLVSGAILGGICGYMVNNTFLGSAIGILVAVAVAGKIEDEKRT